MNGTPTGVHWYISLQETEWGRETTLLLHTDTHYVNIQPDGSMFMTPFEEGTRVAAPTLRFSSIYRDQLIEAAKKLLAPQLEERSREYGALEGRRAAEHEALLHERGRVDQLIEKLLGNS